MTCFSHVRQCIHVGLLPCDILVLVSGSDLQLFVNEMWIAKALATIDRSAWLEDGKSRQQTLYPLQILISCDLLVGACTTTKQALEDSAIEARCRMPDYGGLCGAIYGDYFMAFVSSVLAGLIHPLPTVASNLGCL